MAISKRDVDALQPGAVIWDSGRGSVSGFGVRCQRTAKTFILKTVVSQKARWITIGRFGSPWTVETARDKAKELLGQVAAGIDPIAEAKREPELTIAELCDRYMEAANAGRVLTRFRRPKKASTLAIDVGRIDRHIKPLLGSKIAADVTRADVLRMIDDISAGKTAVNEKTGRRGRAIVRGGAGTAARVADLLSGIFAWASKRGYVASNPVHGAERLRGDSRDRFLTDREFEALGKVLRNGRDDAGRSFNPYAIEIIILLALTGCRLNEIAGIRAEEIDVGGCCLRLGDTKTGKSVRAVGTVVVERLSQLQIQAGEGWVFPARSGDRHYQGTKREVLKIFAAAGITNATCQTLRHSFATVASRLEYSDATIGGLLGHKGRTMTSRYVHRVDASLIAAADAISGHIARAMKGG